MRRIWAAPTFEVHGLTGGYHGPGVKTVVPGHGELESQHAAGAESNSGEGLCVAQETCRQAESEREGRAGRHACSRSRDSSKGPMSKR